MKKKIMIGFLIPLVFCVINYLILSVPFNFIEVIMITLVGFISMYNYGKYKDYLNPLVYFPVLYFLIYWMGDFNFGLGYEPTNNTMWFYYLLGLAGFYSGALIVVKIKINKHTKRDEDDFLKGDTRIIFFIIYLICIACKCMAFSISGIPLLVRNIDATRQIMGETTGIFKVISSAHTILAVFFFYDIISRKVNNKKIKYSSVVVIIISITISLLEMSRLLLIQMFIPMLFIYTLKYKRIKLKNIMKAAFIVLFLIGGIKFLRNILENPLYFDYVIKNRNSNIFANIFLSGFNSFRVAIDDFRLLIEVVPKHSDYTYGKMFLNSVFSFLPGKQVVMGYYVAELLRMSFDGIGAATTILGMFYLDGGPILIYFGMMLFSIFIYRNYIKYIKDSNIDIYSLVGVYVIYYSIFALRTNVMPTIEPLLFIFYYSLFGYLVRVTRKK